jgi:predicted RNA-binding protein (virulence factor B family)
MPIPRKEFERSKKWVNLREEMLYFLKKNKDKAYEHDELKEIFSHWSERNFGKALGRLLEEGYIKRKWVGKEIYYCYGWRD